MSEVNIYKGISEKRKQQMKEYNRNHREQCRIAQRKYYESHKEYYKSFNRNRFKEQQHEIERLNNKIKELEQLNQANYLSFIQCNNIINELKKYLEYEIEEWKDVENEWGKIRATEDENILDKIKELENSGSDE